MIIGILADTHNHLDNTRRALDIFKQRDVERIVHCGDITAPPVIRLFEGWQVVFVFGNIDHDHADMMLAAKQWLGIGMIGYTYTANWDGKHIAVIHGHEQDQLDEMIHSGLYDYVFHGHTHLRRDERNGSTRVINPGAVGGKQKQSRSVCVLDTETDDVTFIELPD